MPSVDIGEFDNIHPIDKKPIGTRLALAALANEYGIDIPWRSPKIKDIVRENGSFVLSFTEAKKLSAKGDAPRGFFITFADGETAEADVIIEGNTVRITADKPIIKIGYCNRNYAIANIFNENDLPLFPFSKEV